MYICVGATLRYRKQCLAMDSYQSNRIILHTKHGSICKFRRYWHCLVIERVTIYWLTHWGRVTHICVGKLIIIGSDNGLSPGRRQAIIWTNAGIWSMGPLGTNLSDILIEIHTFSFKKMHFKMSSAKWRLFCLGLNVLNQIQQNENKRHMPWYESLWDFIY